MQRLPHRDLLDRTRRKTLDVPCPHNGRDSKRQGLSRHAIQIGEGAFPELLFPTGVVKRDYLDQSRVGKIRDGGIIESDVPILSDPDTGEVNLNRVQQSGVTVAFSRCVRCKAVERIKLPEWQRVNDPILEKAHETGLVIES